MKYRKRPVEIEAICVTEALTENSLDIPTWLFEAIEEGIITLSNDGVLIKTLEGTMLGNMGDWIIQGVKGELYPCKPDIFEVTYELS